MLIEARWRGEGEEEIPGNTVISALAFSQRASPFIVFSSAAAKSSFDQVIRPASLISSTQNIGWGPLDNSLIFPCCCYPPFFSLTNLK